MNRLLPAWPGMLLGLCFSLMGAAANADWQVHSVFSTAEGTVQYVQLYNPAGGEPALSGRVLTVRNAAGSVTATHTFNRNLTGTTADRFLLLATPGFAALPGGIEPDFEIPAGFVQQNGGSITFAGLSSLAYSAADLPKNGRQARSQGGLIPSNPQNQIQQQAQIAIPAVAYYEAASQSVRLPVVTVGGTIYDVVLNLVSAAPIQLRLGAFYAYNGTVLTDTTSSRFVGTVLTVPRITVGADTLGSELDLVNAADFTFGNLRFLAPVPLPDQPTPLPDPDPEPDPQLAQSIQRGSSLYGQQCAICHCSSGAGFCSGGAPPVFGNLATHDALSEYIDIAMPQGSPSLCTGQCADDIANYILEALQP